MRAEKPISVTDPSASQLPPLCPLLDRLPDRRLAQASENARVQQMRQRHACSPGARSARAGSRSPLSVVDAPLLRSEIDPSPDNRLRETRRLAADKVTTIPRSKLGERLGVLVGIDLIRLNRAIVVFLGLASTS